MLEILLARYWATAMAVPWVKLSATMLVLQLAEVLVLELVMVKGQVMVQAMEQSLEEKMVLGRVLEMEKQLAHAWDSQ